MEQKDLSLPMEILPAPAPGPGPAPATHLIRSPQVVTDKLRADSFAREGSSHRFKTHFQPQQQQQQQQPQPQPQPQQQVSAQATAPAAHRKDKVVFVLGSTGVGKSKLAIDLATHFDGEVINSDKMQVYAGLNVITNKVTAEECAGIPHHLIGGVHPDAEFTAADFRREATRAVESIMARGRLPVIAGGSNSYIEELVIGDGGKFASKYDCCFIWIDVELPVLHSFVSARVDKMVEMGLVEEARGVFEPEAADYSKGIRQSIGVPEMDRFFRAEMSPLADENTKARLLKEAIEETKKNTRELIYNQLQKIRRFSTFPGWDVRRVDATEAFRKRGTQEAEQVWSRVAREPSIKIAQNFLMNNMEPSEVMSADVNAEQEHKVAVVAPTCTTTELGSPREVGPGPNVGWGSGSLSEPLVCVDDWGSSAHSGEMRDRR